MGQREDYAKESPELFRKYSQFNAALKGGAIEERILDLVSIRASQLNGCAFCVDMHAKEARIHGERELRLYHVAVWRESPLFDARERAALAWTEVLTRLPEHGVSDELYEEVRRALSGKELADLTFAVVAINGWNRIAVGFRTPPGSADAVYGLDQAHLS